MREKVRRDIVISEETDLTEDLLEVLIRLSAVWEKEDSCHGYRKNEKADIEGNRIFTAKDKDTVIGYLFGHREVSEKASSVMPVGTPYFEVEELYVQPEYRSRGIGRMLFSGAEEAVRNDSDYIMLSTATKNWKAILHFYLDELGMEFWNARLFKKLEQDDSPSEGIKKKRRTPLSERRLPDYTRGEEIFNMVTHIVGGALAAAILTLSVIMAALHGNVWGVVGSAIYGGTMVIMFTISSIYHGLKHGTGKKVMQVIDHCDIYFLIAGTYTPILLSAVRPVYPGLAWVIFGIEWAACFTAAVFNAIDLKKYKIPSFICYLLMGWCIIFCAKPTIEAMSMRGFSWILGGGIAFTIGALLYLVGKKKRYMHSVFHIFVVAGCVLQFFGILYYVL